MAEPIVTNNPPITEDAFLADRKKFWSWFTGFTRNAALGVVVLLILLAYFLA